MNWLLCLTLTTLFLFSMQSFGADSPLCENLSRFACAPGSYDDGTGKVKSVEETGKEIAQFVNKYKSKSIDRWKKELSENDNSYFREIALGALGLKNSPDCTSDERSKKERCNENLVAGISRAMEPLMFGNVGPAPNPLARPGNMKEAGFLIEHELFQNVLKDLRNEASKDLSQTESTKKIKEKVFPQMKSLMIQRLKELPISEKSREHMISKLKDIKFNGNECASFQRLGADSLLVPNALYHPGRNSSELCNGYLFSFSSEFAMARAIGHELAHSIDPCIIDHGPADVGFHYSKKSDLKKKMEEYPIPNIIQCLRDERSVNAKSSQMLGNMQPMGGGMMQNNPPEPPQETTAPESFCGGEHSHDQINEAFCDWLSNEVTPLYIEKNFKLTTEQYRIGYSNIFRTICSTQTRDENSQPGTHPRTEDRIDRLILTNPKVRAHMGCSKPHSEYIYCDPATYKPKAEATNKNKSKFYQPMIQPPTMPKGESK